jgi:uncharacterized protein (DUF169 family)
MNTEIRDKFIKKWRKYFKNADLPIIFYYTNKPFETNEMHASQKWSCIICELSRVRKGESLSYNHESITCFGARRYMGFTDKLRPNFEYFLSCGIENKMEGERYIRTPELVNELMKNQKKLDRQGTYIVFKRWDKLTEKDNPEVVIFFAVPDVLSGLFTLANFDQSEPNSTITPFGSGCGSIVYYPFIEKDNERLRAVIGMFDVSARPCVQENILTFSVPFIKFRKMIDYMDESFLITNQWNKVRGRI